MKKILVPVDFSEVSISAAMFAVEIAKMSKAKLILLHSAFFNYYNDISYGMTYNYQPLIEEFEREINEKLEGLRKRVAADVECEICVSGLSLIESIKDIVADEGIDLIAVGTHGSSGLGEFFIGSNTEKIVRKVKCPVIAIPSKTSVNSIKKILVPIDIREIQDELMKKFAQLQKFFSASMEFVWVRTPHNIENEKVVREKFDSLMKTYGFQDSELCIICSVFPAEGILAYSQESKANMIAMATHARRGISHLLAGSMTEDTINHISIPVWTYKLDKKVKNIDLFN
ncbi:universal stress protein [Ekhidna sp.]